VARKDRSVVNLTGGMDFYVREGQGSAQLRSPEVTKAGLRLWGWIWCMARRPRHGIHPDKAL
jgi:hypothetical protein